MEAASIEIPLLLPRLRPDQATIAVHPAKIKVLSMGRRWGKSVLGTAVSLATAAAGGKVAWIAPTYKNTRPLWRTVEAALAPLEKAGLCTIRRAERTVEFKNGGFLGVYSADNPTSILGEWFHLVIVDEAARVSEVVWTDTIQPTLADADGDAILISTPKGKNWFYDEWQRGKDKLKQDPNNSEIAAWCAPTADNPNPSIKKAAKLAENRVGSKTYRQEWLAEFIDDGGEVFRLPKHTITATPQEQAIPGHTYVFGVDTAPVRDYNAIVVIDITTNELVHVDKFNNLETNLIVARIVGINSRFRPSVIVIEENGAQAIIQELNRKKLPIVAFKTSNASKAVLVDKLVLALETAALRIVNHKDLISELQSIESTRLPSGMIRYAAPSGRNDDCFMASLLAWHAAESVDSEAMKCATFEINEDGIQVLNGEYEGRTATFEQLKDVAFISYSEGFFAIARVWLDHENFRHIVECWRKKTHPGDAIENAYRLHSKRAFESLGIEDKLYNQLEQEFAQLESKYSSLEIPLPIYPVELLPDKQLRHFTAIQSPLASHRVTASTFIQRQGEVWSQILNLNSIEDDARDAIAGALWLAENSY